MSLRNGPRNLGRGPPSPFPNGDIKHSVTKRKRKSKSGAPWSHYSPPPLRPPFPVPHCTPSSRLNEGRGWGGAGPTPSRLRRWSPPVAFPSPSPSTVGIAIGLLGRGQSRQGQGENVSLCDGRGRVRGVEYRGGGPGHPVPLRTAGGGRGKRARGLGRAVAITGAASAVRWAESPHEKWARTSGPLRVRSITLDKLDSRQSALVRRF